MNIRINNIDEISAAAEKFVAAIGDRKIIAFYGSMGAGKTTFVKALCEVMGVKDSVTSPTFAIVNEYALPDNDSIYHFDFYRIKKIEEVFDMGFEDYFYSGALCFIEWPELIEDVLPIDTVKVSISQQPDGSRRITAKL